MPRRRRRPNLSLFGCKWCGREPGCRPRRLCSTCYLDPEIRRLFPAVVPEGRRGLLGDADWYPLAEEPSWSEPGSFQRIADYEQRADEGKAVFHPGDLIKGDGECLIIVTAIPAKTGKRKMDDEDDEDIDPGPPWPQVAEQRPESFKAAVWRFVSRIGER